MQAGIVKFDDARNQTVNADCHQYSHSDYSKNLSDESGFLYRAH